MKMIANLIRANLNLTIFVPLLSIALLATWYGLFTSVEHFASLTSGLRFMDMQPQLTVAALFESDCLFFLDEVLHLIEQTSSTTAHAQ